MALNPFLVAEARKKFTSQGLDVGDRVIITWRGRYGEELSFTGTIRALGSWTRITEGDEDRGMTYWYFPTTMVETVRSAAPPDKVPDS